MNCKRHIIVCEGESEFTYLQRLQSFIDKQPLIDGYFEAPLRFISPRNAVAKTGSFGKLKSSYNTARKNSRGASSIQIWADFDLYNRNDHNCATNYKAKSLGIPDFLFSFHNVEDFFALHHDGSCLEQWLDFGARSGKNHFHSPLRSEGYLPEIKRIFPNYSKGGLPSDFITWNSLRKLKANLERQPSMHNPNSLSIKSFAEFLISEIAHAFPSYLE